MTSEGGQTAIKGKLLYFLLTDDYGIGESQCKMERLVQCAPIPQHRQRDAKEAVDDMLRDPEVPLYSKGGSSRDVVQINPSQLEQVQELANEWHPDRTAGESFDRTDLSEPDREEAVVSLAYEHKGTAWNVLEDADVEFDHTHGSVADHAPADHIQFTLRGTSDGVTETVERLTDATSGDLAAHETPEPAVAAAPA